MPAARRPRRPRTTNEDRIIALGGIQALRRSSRLAASAFRRYVEHEEMEMEVDADSDCEITEVRYRSSVQKGGEEEGGNAVYFDTAFTSPALRILVGPENKQTTFYCHSAILAARSPYFASIISGNYLETSTNEVGLTSEVDDPQTFKSIVEYMYSGNYNTKSITSQKGTSNRVKRGEVALLHVKVFLMASRLCMDALEKLCLRKLWDEIYPKDSFLSFHDLCTLIDLVYTHTPSRAISSNALLTALSEDMHAFARFISCPPSAITKVSPTTMENIKSSDKLRALLVSYASKEFLFMDLIRDEKNGFVGLLERHVDFVLDLLSVNASSKLMQPRRELFCGK